MILAVTRDVSPRFNECEITHIDRTPIDVNVAQSQHHEYVQALKELGCAVLELPAQADLPDSVFVEDTAVILPEVALITRPGADSRKPEIESIIPVLRPYRELVFIEAPGTVDGGDVLVLGKNIYVGKSTRSNAAAVDQMNNLLGKYGYYVQAVELHDCLHLKTAATLVADDTLLVNPAWTDAAQFGALRTIEVHPDEPFAANTLRIDDVVIYPAEHVRTIERLERAGLTVRRVAIGELLKAEGSVTCLSLVVR